MAAVSHVASKPVIWHKVLIFTLGFWISSSLFLDMVIMPSLYQAGMLTQPDFATAGYSLFGAFNRLELLCAALVLTSVFTQYHLGHIRKPSHVMFSLLLLIASFTCTYFLTPHMSALGLQLNLFEPAAIPAGMNQLHLSYWLIEVFKLSAGGMLLLWNVEQLSKTA
ncbi:DUF4149 domain-containing protein [Myxacorys almedinensis]|uniref:DUF4149 domain-containing protein n=1 Tax=Myxacorys almedinensis A TaxID=2690445 RepID=A0A8J7Z2G5_9CYAN|nr:DUF4149 domain-containing protein [Myxacorys almedinensis]NDJ18459.1 DUF4149 domain-containing protein [Myxacorys almedinensis A]